MCSSLPFLIARACTLERLPGSVAVAGDRWGRRRFDVTAIGVFQTQSLDTICVRCDRDCVR